MGIRAGIGGNGARGRSKNDDSRFCCGKIEGPKKSMAEEHKNKQKEIDKKEEQGSGVDFWAQIKGGIGKEVGRGWGNRVDSVKCANRRF